MKQLQKFVNVDNYLLANCDVKYPALIGQTALSPLASCIDNALYYHYLLPFSLTHPGSEQSSNGY